MPVTLHLRQLVIQRAANRCEYCGLSQDSQEATFHVDHIVPATAQGPTEEDNLALACVSCSLRKGARMTATDPVSLEEVPLFHPRKDRWRVHFRWDDNLLTGVSPVGRATVEALKMNRPLALAIRAQEMAMGRHPSPRHL